MEDASGSSAAPAVVTSDKKGAREARGIGRHVTLPRAITGYRRAVELCAPRSPELRRAENPAGNVKRTFLQARTFLNVEQDLPAPLTNWLAEVYSERSNRGTTEIGSEQPVRADILQPLA
jgi:hypothetical protein